MITPDWNKNLSKEKLPLVSSLQIVTAFCSDLNSWRYAGFDESFCISQNILIVLMEVWQWPAVCSISSQLFLLELGEGQGTRDTPAICRFLKSLSAQFLKPFFSKPIFITVMIVLCLCSHTGEHVFMQEQWMCLAVTTGTYLVYKTKCLVHAYVAHLVMDLNLWNARDSWFWKQEFS